MQQTPNPGRYAQLRFIDPMSLTWPTNTCSTVTIGCPTPVGTVSRTEASAPHRSVWLGHAIVILNVRACLTWMVAPFSWIPIPWTEQCWRYWTVLEEDLLHSIIWHYISEKKLLFSLFLPFLTSSAFWGNSGVSSWSKCLWIPSSLLTVVNFRDLLASARLTKSTQGKAMQNAMSLIAIVLRNVRTSGAEVRDVSECTSRMQLSVYTVLFLPRVLFFPREKGGVERKKSGKGKKYDAVSLFWMGRYLAFLLFFVILFKWLGN